jgi:membrane protein YqaA with SNARE-associated domain
MKSIMAWAGGLTGAFGGWGLFVVAFLDSSFLSLPGINDILVVRMVTQHKDRFLYYAAMSTLGSIAGCLVIYWLAWKGGEAFVRKRFGSAKVEHGLDTVRRYGVLALLVPSMLPPPAPFKVFVILAGVVRIRPLSFMLAIGIGRGLRYFVEGLLAVWYGDMASRYISEHGKLVALVAALVVLVVGLAVAWWHRRQRLIGERQAGQEGSQAR